MASRTLIRNASAAVIAAALTIGAAGTSAIAQGYAGSAASAATTLGATASPPTIQVPVYGPARTHR